MSKKTKWLIIAQTNLHVGSENVSGFEIADKTVQRDVLTKFPCINASSLKGAINEYCCEVAKLDATDIYDIFGNDKLNRIKDEKGKKKNQKGKYIFNDAQLLLLSVQDEDFHFHWETTEAILEITRLTVDNLKEKLLQLHPLKEKFAEKPIIKPIEQNEFAEKCKDLPIIARNHLDNGTSVNLFYEEVVPSQTVFVTTIESGDDVLTEAINDKVIQIGAGATIGRGYCKFIKLENDESAK
ncbi:hypothetical protein FACS189414_1060 [Bacteroidia bacterium]|nr:hypothetical protein FACS189414_1060 [Bacteroidia bacterium]